MIVKENEKLMQAISEENNKFVCVLMMHKWHGGMDINQGGSILCFLFVFSYPPQPQHPLRKTESVDGCRLVNTLFVRQKAVFQDKINHETIKRSNLFFFLLTWRVRQFFSLMYMYSKQRFWAGCIYSEKLCTSLKSSHFDEGDNLQLRSFWAYF